MLSYDNFSSERALREEFAHTQPKALHIFVIQCRPSSCFTLSLPCPGLAVGQTLPFCFFQRFSFDEQILLFIPFPGTTPL